MIDCCVRKHCHLEFSSLAHTHTHRHHHMIMQLAQTFRQPDFITCNVLSMDSLTTTWTMSLVTPATMEMEARSFVVGSLGMQ